MNYNNNKKKLSNKKHIQKLLYTQKQKCFETFVVFLELIQNVFGI